MKENASLKNGRRDFILKSFSSCAFCCVAAPIAFAADKKLNSTMSIQQHKFQSDSGMSIQGAYNFAFKEWYIPAMKNLMEQIGREKFIDMLKTSSEMLHVHDEDAYNYYSERTLSEWATRIKYICENWSDRITFEILNNNETVFEMKFSECLWAKTFREEDASEIGYAGVCYQDYPMTKAFNPNLKLIRDKTLMQGQDCCHFKWVTET
jgi:hypothetical protein